MSRLRHEGLTDQERFGFWVVQAGRVELHELHIGNSAAGAPGHRNAVSGRAVWVAGVEVNLAGSARRQYDELGPKNLDFIGILGLVHKLRYIFGNLFCFGR